MDKFSKTIELKEFKALDDMPHGGFEGVYNEMFFVDDGADIVIGCSDLDSFVKNGFAPDTHGAGQGYTYENTLGYPTSAEVKGYSIYGGFAFHSTDDAQKVRTKMQERKNAGKSVSLSIGYYLTEAPIYVDQKNYATEFPKYIPNERLQSCLEGAKRFSRVRLIKVGLYEVSPVPIPMNSQSLVSNVKGVKMDNSEIDNYLGDSALESISVGALDTLYYRLWSVIWEQVKYNSAPKSEKIESISAALEKFKTTYLIVLTSLLPEGEDSGEKLSEIEEEIKSIFGSTAEEFYEKRIERTFNAQIASCIKGMNHIVNRAEIIASKPEGFTTKNEKESVSLRETALALCEKFDSLIPVEVKDTEQTTDQEVNKDIDLLLETEVLLSTTEID